MCSHVPRRPPSDRVKADEAVTKPTSKASSEGDARGSGGSMMMRRGLTLRHNGATATCAPAAGSDPGPEFCHLHLHHLASASASAARPQSFAVVDKGPEPCRARLFPTCLAASARAGDLEHGAELSHLNPAQLEMFLFAPP